MNTQGHDSVVFCFPYRADIVDAVRAIPGRRFDWPKLRAHLGVSRMSLPDADEAKAVTGYVRYTITPFGSTRVALTPSLLLPNTHPPPSAIRP